MLHSREVADISANTSLVNRKVIDKCCDMFDVHIRVINSIAGVTMLALLNDKIHVLHEDIFNLEREVALLLLIFLCEFIHHLLDVHHAIGCFADIEIAICDCTITQRNALCSIETREKNFKMANI